MRWSSSATLLACTAIALAAFGLLHALTGAGSHWTFEDRRRAQARAGDLVAAALAEPAPSRGSIRIVDFIYTRCPTVCRVLGSEYALMQRELLEGGDRRIRLVSISFDVANDGPEQLLAYGRAHGAMPPTWVIAGGGTAADDARLRRELGVVAIPDGLGGYVHNGAIHLVDDRGRVHDIYDHADWTRALSRARSLAAGAP